MSFQDPVEEPTYEQNTIAEVISMRIPTLWLHAVDPVEAIEKIHNEVELYEDLDLYLFDSIRGLQVYNRLWNRFHTVHKRMEKVYIKDTGEQDIMVFHMPIVEVEEAIPYLADDPTATLVLANAETFEDKLNSIFTFMNFGWRNGYSRDNLGYVGMQLIMVSSTMPAPPEGVGAFVPTSRMGYPTREELTQTIAYVKEKTHADIDVPAVAASSRGLTTFEATNIYHSQISRTGKIDARELEDLTFRRLAERAGIDIFRPKITLDQVAGAENLKRILETSLWLRDNAEEAKKFGYSTSLHRFMLLGLPGVGKSMFCEAAAKHLGLNLVRSGLTHMLSKFHGESEQNVRSFFEIIKQLDPVCVWFDEFGRDASGGQSSHVVDGGVTSRTHGLFLTGIQEMSETTYFFAAANDISTLAPEMLRADRFDKIFFVGFPTFIQRHQIISQFLSEIEHDVNVQQIAQGTASYTGAEIKTAVAAASNYALSERRKISTEDMTNAFSKMKSTVWKVYKGTVINSYRTALDSYEWASDDQRSEGSSYADGRIPKNSVIRTKTAASPVAASNVELA